MEEQELNNIKINMAELKNDISYIKDALVENKAQHKEIMSKIDHLGDTFQGKIQDKADQKEVMAKFSDYVTKESFTTIQRIVYGLSGAILLAFVYALIDGVIKR